MNIVNLPLPDQDPIAQFVRIGHDYLQMDELLASGRFPVDRAVLRAALVPQQGALLTALRAAGREAVSILGSLISSTRGALKQARATFLGLSRGDHWSGPMS